ncbi:fibroblast growth factor 10b [Hemibagrus wyckioides]|uniref:fibroblast growth factor 10b n=1 Tax=Hemibagrus wyckioides TaxID=337641 RepID=UPI00266BA9AE|nr:fibroblast growth factor 10b [Hemibagrus wyckioides]
MVSVFVCVCVCVYPPLLLVFPRSCSPRCAAVMMVTWCASGGWSLCLLPALVTVLISARTVTCRIAPPGVTANITDSDISNSDISNSSTRFSSAAPVRHARSYAHLQGDSRRRKLFSFQRFFLRIDGTGRVTGTRSGHDSHTLLEIRSVDVGVVAIRSLSTGYYLAMNRRGDVYGEREFSVNCGLKERIEENGYNTYASVRWRKGRRAMFISLNADGKPLRGRKTHRKNTNTHFLPISVGV